MPIGGDVRFRIADALSFGRMKIRVGNCTNTGVVLSMAFKIVAAPSGVTESLILMKLCVLLLRVLMEVTLLETARFRAEQNFCVIFSTLFLSVNDVYID